MEEFKKLEFEVGDPIQSGSVKTVHEYLIKIFKDGKETASIYRRYSHFEFFRNVLFYSYPTISIPSIPPKAYFVDVEDRKYSLNAFLNLIVEVEELLKSDHLKRFIADAGYDSIVSAGCCDIPTQTITESTTGFIGGLWSKIGQKIVDPLWKKTA